MTQIEKIKDFKSFIDLMYILIAEGYNENSLHRKVDVFLNQNHPEIPLFATKLNYDKAWNTFNTLTDMFSISVK